MILPLTHTKTQADRASNDNIMHDHNRIVPAPEKEAHQSRVPDDTPHLLAAKEKPRKVRVPVYHQVGVANGCRPGSAAILRATVASCQTPLHLYTEYRPVFACGGAYLVVHWHCHPLRVAEDRGHADV